MASVWLEHEAQIRTPELLTPWRQPTYPVKVDRNHPFTKGLVACWPLWQSSGAYVRDLWGNNHGYFAGTTNPGMGVYTNGGYGKGVAVTTDTTNSRFDLGSVSADHPLSMSTDNEVSVFFFGFIPTSATAGNTSPRIIDKGNGSNATNGWGLAIAPDQSDLYFMRGGTGYSSPNTIGTLDRVHAVGVAMASGDMNFFADGRSIGTLSNTWSISTTTVNARLFNWDDTSTDRQYRGGPSFVLMVWNRRVEDEVILSLCLDPYMMFLPA